MNVTAEAATFGSVLRRLRLAAQLSQEQLAERAALSVESISALERGRRRAPYRETVRMLSDGLGLAPSQRSELETAAARTKRTTLGVVTFDSARDATPAELSPADHTLLHNLPLQRTILVGRAGDVGAVVRIVEANRLVTIAGAGGIGKTRTALAVGDAVFETFANGVWLVELAAVTEGPAVAAAIARALHVPERANVPLRETLMSYLQRKSPLLILDNCEHVIVEVAALADILLRACPQLKILATSREPLRIAGERTYRLPPLSIPTPETARRLGAGEARTYAAVTLFTQSAQRSDHEFALDDANASLVAAICQRLDGIPLAIELAAARINVLSLQDVLTRLDGRFQILTGGERTALPRQQTMRALIDWSYDLLAEAEQRLFERLSIFAGGCTLSSAAAVYDDAADDFAVLELLSSLADKSLVSVDLDVPEPRYRLLETSRQYAAEKLAARAETAVVARRHAQAYVELAEQMEREHDAARNSVWYARADLEIENWRAALQWTLVEGGDPVLGQRLAGAMRAVWPVSAIAEGRRWLDVALASVDARTPLMVAANLEHSVVTVAYLSGEFEISLERSRRLTQRFTELGDRLGTARAEFVMGRSLANLGRVAEGEPLLQRSLHAARALSNAPLEGLALAGLARSRSLQGDIPAARAYLAQAFALCESAGADAYSVIVESAAAGIEFRAGNVERAAALSTASLAAMRSFGLTLFATMELNLLAAYLIAAGEWVSARAHAHAALGAAHESQQRIEIAWALQNLVAAATLPAPAPADEMPRLERAGTIVGFIDASIATIGASRQFVYEQQRDAILAVLRRRLTTPRTDELLTAGAMYDERHVVDLARSL